MSRYNDLPEKREGLALVFNSDQILAIQELENRTPKIVRFLLADKFDDKFLITTSDIWEYYYSGKKEKIILSSLNDYEKILLKFFLIYYIQKNTPSNLSKIFYSYICLLNYFKDNNLNFCYEQFKLFLINIASEEKLVNLYYHIKFILRLLISEGFSGFDVDDDYELEIISRPQSFNSKLFYQQYEDPIDYPLISMIQKGFVKINDQIKFEKKELDDQTLLYASILGLVYSTGLRPVQLAKLSVDDIKKDTICINENFSRYSILIPYAKKLKFSYDKIAVKLPEEIAEIIMAYIIRFRLLKSERLFNMGDNSAAFCSTALNGQLFDFSPPYYKEAVLNGEMIQEKYTCSDFRHHVGYSMAMAGASAEEIAYMLGHSVLVTARYYIYSTPILAQIRAHALGRNILYKQMIGMILSGHFVYRNDWKKKKVLGSLGGKIHHNIGGCSYEDKCLFQPVRNCYGCIYFHPFIDADHAVVLQSIQDEINDLIRLSDSVGFSRNPLSRVLESTKFEIESVVALSKIYMD